MRYTVEKKSGSRFAYVIDTKTGNAIKRYDIMKGLRGKGLDGWQMADRHRDRLNAMDKTTPTGEENE